MKWLKRITWYKQKPCDILIYDGEGSDLLICCIPYGRDFFIIRNRIEVPLFISLYFFLWIIFGLIKFRNIHAAIILAITKNLRTKVIITYIDNAPTICWIKKLIPSIPVIAVQNGTRWDFSVKNKTLMEYDYYFSFGSVEADIFSQGGHTVSNFYPVGSLRAGVFRDKYPILKPKAFDLCYISQFIPIPLNVSELDKWTLQLINSYNYVGKRLFDIISKFAEEKQLSLCVAMRYPINSSDFEVEHEYYSYHGNAKIELIIQNEFSSYNAVQASQLSFTISSTLGYEALGLGERIIFAKDVPPVNSLVTQGPWSNNLVTHRLPELQRLYSLDYSEIRIKASEMLEMTDQGYMDYSRSAREYYMNYNDALRPQKFIENKIIELLNY